MTRSRVITIFSVLLFCVHFLYGQELPISPSTPGPSGVSPMGKSSAKNYTGNAEVSMSLYNYSSKKLSLPISMFYQGGAFKIQDVTGLVGLGWNLQIGGCITRVMKGKPDEQANGFAADSTVTATGTKVAAAYNSTGYGDFVKKVASNEWDGEPDIFASSMGGKFVLNNNKEAVFSVQSGYQVLQNALYPTSATNRPWIIADPYGNKYYFGGALNSTEAVRYKSDNVTSKPYVNLWYLNKIVSADGQDSIQLSYVNGSDSLTYTYFKRMHITKSYPCFVSDSYDMNDNFTITTLQPRYLTMVTGNNFKVEISYENRGDNPGLCVKRLQIFNRDQSEYRKINDYVFKYGYFKDADGKDSARLKLSSIYTVDSLDMRTLLAGFEYNETVNLPPRNSVQFDHWGYYNSNAAGTSIPPLADKSVDTIRSKANLLMRANWKSGGYTTYGYEQNTAVVADTLRQVGGVRIALISVHMPASNRTLTTKYRYVLENGQSSGLVYNGYPQKYYSYKVYGSPTYVSAVSGDVTGGCAGYTETIQDETFADLFDVYGVGLGYSRVETQYPDGSREVSLYTDLNDWNQDNINFYRVNAAGDVSAPSGNYRFGPPFSAQTSYGFMRGLIKESRIYKSDSALQGITRYRYDSCVNTANRIFGIRVMQLNSPYGSLWSGSKYEELCALAQLVGVREVGFPGANPNDSIVTEKKIEYNGRMPFLIKRSAASINNGDSTIAQFRYPGDFTDSSSVIYNKMLAANMVGFAVEEVHSLKRSGQSRVTMGAISLYRLETLGGISVPLFSQKRVLNLDKPLVSYQWLRSNGVYDPHYAQTFYIDKYDTRGNILQYTLKGNIPHFNIWDNFTGAFKLADISYVGEGEFYYMGFELENFPVGYSYLSLRSGGAHTGTMYYVQNVTLDFTPPNSKKYNVSYWSKNGGIWNYSGKLPYIKGMVLAANEGIDDIRISPEGSIMDTYAYNPLVGLTSTTDENGKTTNYEYDGEEHLKWIRDNDSNLVKGYQYEYANPSISGGVSCAKVTGPIAVTRTAANTWSASWTAVAGVSGYKVEYRRERDDSWTSQNVSVNSCTISNLERITAYEIRVTAQCSGNTRVQPSAIKVFKSTDMLLKLGFALSGNSSNNHVILTASLSSNSGLPISFKWGYCVLNTSISTTFQYCYGFAGASSDPDAYTVTTIPYSATTYTDQSTSVTPGSSFGEIKKIVIYNVTGISPWDIQQQGTGTYEFIVQ